MCLACGATSAINAPSPSASRTPNATDCAWAQPDRAGACRALRITAGTGEDNPEPLPRLLARLETADNPHVIFAERTRRGEGLFFRAFYHLYRVLHLVLTGIPVRVGNFSVMSAPVLERLVAVS